MLTAIGGVWAWFPWVVWFLALVACPVAISVIGAVYKNHGPPDHDHKIWTYDVVCKLGLAHVVVSIVASVAVVLLARGPGRWLAWAAVPVIGLIAAVVSLARPLQQPATTCRKNACHSRRTPDQRDALPAGRFHRKSRRFWKRAEA